MINKIIINNIIKKGKGLLAKNIFKKTFVKIKNDLKQNNSLRTITHSLQNVQPKIEFKTKKVSGSVYKIPSPYKDTDKFSLAAKWIIGNSQKNKGKPMDIRLTKEIIDSFSKRGDVLKKKKEIYKQAIVNKVNLKYM